MNQKDFTNLFNSKRKAVFNYQQMLHKRKEKIIDEINHDYSEKGGNNDIIT